MGCQDEDCLECKNVIVNRECLRDDMFHSRPNVREGKIDREIDSKHIEKQKQTGVDQIPTVIVILNTAKDLSSETK